MCIVFICKNSLLGLFFCLYIRYVKYGIKRVDRKILDVVFGAFYLHIQTCFLIL
jgi:hypothetical protein